MGIVGSRRKLDRAEEQFPDGAGGRYRNPGARKRPGAGDTRAIDLDIRRSDADRKDGCECGGSPLTFFPLRTATTWHLRNRRWSAGQKVFTAKNPPYGAILSYYLKEAEPR